jgi:hypothetical protein
MADYNVLYEKHEANSLIGASASETFFSGQPAQENKQKYGSFNSLELINDSNEEIYVFLDGLDTRKRILGAKANLIIEPQEGIYFNTLKITNSSAVNTIAANLILPIARICEAIVAAVVSVDKLK